MSVKEAPVDGSAGGPYPWSGDPRAEDKTRLFRYLRYSPDGAPLSLIVRHVLDVDAGDEDGRRYQREYQFAKRFVESATIGEDDRPAFKIDRGQGLIHVAPRPAAFDLTGKKHFPNNRRVYEFPKDYAQNFLNSRGFDEITKPRAEIIEEQFVTYLKQIEDRWNILRRRETFTEDGEREHGPEYLLVPYKTLYNDESRVSDNWRRYHGAWENATREHATGAQLVLTTDPKRFESIQEMVEATSENFNRFMSWLRRRRADRCDDVGTKGHRIKECSDCEEFAERPPYIKVLEWTEKGRPHLHIIFFGISWIADKQEISDYWGKRQAEIVHARTVSRVRVGGNHRESAIEVDGDHYIWYSKTTDESGKIKRKNEKAHLGKYLTKQMPASESVATIEEMVGGEENLWKTALFWATGRHFWSCSMDLKDEPAPLVDPELRNRYVYVGAATSAQIPGHVLERARVLYEDRPPPGGS